MVSRITAPQRRPMSQICDFVTLLSDRDFALVIKFREDGKITDYLGRLKVITSALI